MKQSLAVKYRPQTFEEVCGQQIAVKILKKAVETGNFKHCYLFAGDSGCGKTTLARCFARAINKGLGAPEEIDAASNNGVDEIRELREYALTSLTSLNSLISLSIPIRLFKAK
jgi:DNA polymerase-3 subunit gamma/tau